MKLLFAIQATGNGHLVRAHELISQFKKHADLDLLVSGNQAEIKLDYPVKYRYHGLGYIFGKKGGIDWRATILNLRLGQLRKDIRNLPIENYDCLVNDFEPISAYAAKFKGIRVRSLSHQAAFLSAKTPRPSKRSHLAELIFKYYAPAQEFIGLHFQAYDDFIHSPIIRREVRILQTSNDNYIAVYLPAVHHYKLLKVFRLLRGWRWKIFSKHTHESFKIENVEVRPIENKAWLEALADCSGLILGAGFEAPAEALFLGKPLLIIPMTDQYEQQCNAVALEQLGVKVVWKPKYLASEVKTWLENLKPLQCQYSDNAKLIVDQIMSQINTK